MTYVVSDIHGCYSETSVSECVSDRTVYGVFESYMIYGHFSQYRCQVVSDLLGAGSDDDLVRGACYTSGHVKVPGDLMSEDRFALRITLKKKAMMMIRSLPCSCIFSIY